MRYAVDRNQCNIAQVHHTVRIPAAVMEAMHLDLDEVVDVGAENGKIVIEPVLQKDYALDDLLKTITAKNLHEAVDFGSPKGKEVW